MGAYYLGRDGRGGASSYLGGVGLTTTYLLNRFIGEESVASGEKCHFTDDPTWIIDPIDGTTNFVHR